MLQCQTCIGGDGETECSQCMLEASRSPVTSVQGSDVTVSSTCVCGSDTTSTDLCVCDTADTESVASYNQSPLHVINPASGVGDGLRQFPYCTVKTNSSDLGYSSGPEGCDSCSASSNSADASGSVLDITHCDRHTPGNTLTLEV